MTRKRMLYAFFSTAKIPKASIKISSSAFEQETIETRYHTFLGTAYAMHFKSQ